LRKRTCLGYFIPTIRAAGYSLSIIKLNMVEVG
jgi:hypothetical protein